MKFISLRTVALVACLAFLAACSRQVLDIQKPADASHARIGVMTGSVGEGLSRTRFPQASIQCFDDIMDAVAAVKADHLDAIVTAWTTAFQVRKRNPDLRLVEEPLEMEQMCAAVKLGNDALLADIDRVLAALAADGTLADMRKRWVKEDLTPYEEAEIEPAATGEPLRIGVSATREPITFVRDGKVSGHDGELARRIGKALGRPVEFLDMKFLALIPALESGKIDAIVTGMNATDERRKRVAFSQPYLENPQVLLVKDHGAAQRPQAGRAPTLEELKQARIAVQTGTVYDIYVKSTFPEATALQFSNYPDVTLAVATGKAEAGLSDAISLISVMEANPELVVVGPPIFSSTVNAGFRKGEPQLREEFNAMLRELRANGTYAQMVERWMKQRSKVMPEIPNPGTNGTLTVGTSSWGLPFCGMQDGKLTGFDMELAERLAARLGRKLVIADQEFAGLIAALVSGKIDVIIADMFATEERAKQIDFSDPYYDQDSVIFARLVGGSTASTKSWWQSFTDSFHANIVHEKRWLLLVDGLKTTGLIAVLATMFGTVLGALVCYARMSKRRLLQLPARAYISVLRGIPVLVLLMLVFYVVFGSVNVSPVLIAVLAFGMNFAAYVSEMFRAGLSSIDRGQREAGTAMGFTEAQTFRFILLPQLIQRVLPVYKGEFISMVKMTSIVGYIAVQDLTKASDIIRSRTFDAFFPLIMVAVLYFLMSWLLVQALEHLERITDPRRRRAKAGAA